MRSRTRINIRGSEMSAMDLDTPWRELVAARSALAYRMSGGLCMEEVPLVQIASSFGTPSYVYGAGTIRARLADLLGAFREQGLTPAVRYAVKANDHLAILSLLRAGGAGADVTSAGEMARALAAGIMPEAIVFSGVGKRRCEIEMALGHGIGQINVESAEELAVLSAIAVSMGKVAPVALRVNPDVTAGGHDKISTGRAGDKFGIAFGEAAALYGYAGTLPGIAPVGFSTHVGSQIFSPSAFEVAYSRVVNLIDRLRGEGAVISRLDLGGGFGIPYDSGPVFPMAAYAAMVRRVAGDRCLDLIVEPGRWLVGPAGVLLTGVTLVKVSVGRKIVILDAGMNDLIRPALYGALHGIVPVGMVASSKPVTITEVVGPVCESSDRFAAACPLPEMAAGELVAILDAGAYGAVMSSSYNGRLRAAEVLVDGRGMTLIRKRQELSELIRDDIVPLGERAPA